jgi:hypothetical protein
MGWRLAISVSLVWNLGLPRRARLRSIYCRLMWQVTRPVGREKNIGTVHDGFASTTDWGPSIVDEYECLDRKLATGLLKQIPVRHMQQRPKREAAVRNDIILHSPAHGGRSTLYPVSQALPTRTGSAVPSQISRPCYGETFAAIVQQRTRKRKVKQSVGRTAKYVDNASRACRKFLPTLAPGYRCTLENCGTSASTQKHMHILASRVKDPGVELWTERLAGIVLAPPLLEAAQ